jgi:hypothetical protein
MLRTFPFFKSGPCPKHNNFSKMKQQSREAGPLEGWKKPIMCD